MSEVKKTGPATYLNWESGETESVTNWTLETEMPESVVYNLPVVREGERYHEYTDAAMEGAFLCESARASRHFGVARDLFLARGFTEKQQITSIFKEQCVCARNSYKIRVFSVLEDDTGEREFVKSGVFYGGDNPREFFKFFSVPDEDVEELLCSK